MGISMVALIFVGKIEFYEYYTHSKPTTREPVPGPNEIKHSIF